MPVPFFSTQSFLKMGRFFSSIFQDSESKMNIEQIRC